LSKTATKKEFAGYKSIINSFDMIIKTPLEKIEQENQLKEALESIDINKSSPDDVNSQSTCDNSEVIDSFSEKEVLLSARREAINAIIIILEQSKSPTGGGISGILNKFLEVQHLKELPKLYQTVFGFIHKNFSPILYMELCEKPSQMAKIKKIYSLTPQRAMSAIMRITNPVSLISSMVNLFFAKPFGAKNMVQRIFVLITEYKRTENDIKQIYNVISNKKIATKISNWVFSNYKSISSQVSYISSEPYFEGVEEPKVYLVNILQDPTIDPIIPDKEIKKFINSYEINSIKDLFFLEIRKRHKEDFIEIFGDEKIINLMKELLPVIYEPLFSLYKNGNAANLLNEFFKLIKNCITVAEVTQKELQNPENIKKRAQIVGNALENYSKALLQFEEGLFLFVRDILTSQKSYKSLEKIIIWATNFIDFGQRNNVIVDVQKLVNQLNIQQREQVIYELERYTTYKNYILQAKKLGNVPQNHKAPSTSNLVNYLTASFLEAVGQFLK